MNNIIFDLDGTLFDTLDDIAQSVKDTFIELSFQVPSSENVRNAIGGGSYQLFMILLDNNKDLTEKALAIFQHIYINNIAVNTKPYPKVKSTLQYLQNKYHLHIMTNKPKKFAIPLIDHFDFNKFFDRIITPEDVSNLKKPDDRLCSLDIMNQAVLFIGDSAIDIEMAHKCRIPSVFVNYGYGDYNDLKPDYEIDCFSKIIDIISDHQQ